MNCPHVSRRTLLRGVTGAVAGAGAATLMGARPALAAGAVWTINAGGWPLELAFFKRLVKADPGELTGGFIANTRNVGSSVWEPVLVYSDKHDGRPFGINFCRLVVRPDQSLEKIQIYRTTMMGSTGPRGYWFEIFAPNQQIPSWRRGSAKYDWHVTEGFSTTGAPWNAGIDTTPRFTGGIDDPVGKPGVANWPITHPANVNLTDMHWYDVGNSRQMWLSLYKSTAVGWTTVSGKLSHTGYEGIYVKHCYVKPFRFVRPTSTRFYSFEFYSGLQREDRWDQQGWEHDAAITTVYRRHGSGVVFHNSDAVSTTGVGSNLGSFTWKTHAFSVNPWGATGDLGFNYDGHYPHGGGA